MEPQVIYLTKYRVNENVSKFKCYNDKGVVFTVVHVRDTWNSSHTNTIRRDVWFRPSTWTDNGQMFMGTTFTSGTGEPFEDGRLCRVRKLDKNFVKGCIDVNVDLNAGFVSD